MTRTRRVVLIILGVVLALVLAAIAGIALLIAALRESQPAVADNSVLVLEVSGALPDHANEDPMLSRFFGAPSQSLEGLVWQLKKAKADKRVAAVLLDIKLVDTGWAKADELRDAIADFRNSNKPIYAFMEYGLDADYYIASACERVYVAPAGDLLINGLAAEVMFFRGSLDKLGVEPQFYQIGKYKNAPDQFTRKEMTKEHEEVVNSLLDQFFGRYVANVAAARRKSEEDVRALIDRAPLSAREAQEAGLIDGALYREDVDKELRSRLGYKGDDKLRTVKGSAYRRVTPESLKLNEGERVAVVFAAGPIGSGRSDDGTFGSPTIGSDTLSKALRDAAEDKSVKAIVLRVDSPGGTNYGSDIIWRAVEEAKRKKPVVVSMSDVAASGGYYISAGAHKIVVQPSTITGSIGIFAGKMNVKGFYDWIGVTNQYVLRGRNAGMFRETENFTEEEFAKFKSMIDSAYWDEFLPKVAEGRKRDVEYVNSVAQGRVWTGQQARENGLADEFGGLDRAVEIAKQLANIPADKGVRRVVYPAPRPFFQELFGGDDEASIKVRAERHAALQTLPEHVRRVARYASVFDRMKHGEMMMMLPYELRIR
ncbi:MAG TPA: signal peptide peptidase SppA [Pyrinomonadaceae bacterium]|nr:signal peptide peptidase SppA [Pyrinomonadaceae bacterium]